MNCFCEGPDDFCQNCRDYYMVEEMLAEMGREDALAGLPFHPSGDDRYAQGWHLGMREVDLIWKGVLTCE